MILKRSVPLAFVCAWRFSLVFGFGWVFLGGSAVVVDIRRQIVRDDITKVGSGLTRGVLRHRAAEAAYALPSLLPSALRPASEVVNDGR